MRNQLIKTSLFSGVLTAILSCVVMAIGYQSGLYTQKIIWTVLTYAIVVAGIVYACIRFKKENEGYMSYGQGVGIGTGVGAVNGLLSGIFSYVYLTTIGKSIADKLMVDMGAELKAKGMTEAVITSSIEMARFNILTPVSIIWALLGVFLQDVLLH